MKFKRILKTILCLALSLGLVSCMRFNVRINYDFSDLNNLLDRFTSRFHKATKSETVVAKVEEDTYDKIIGLEGDVSTTSKYKLPKVGDKIGDFTAKLVFDYYEKDAKVVMFEHEKTGAVCFLISNADMDKSASLGFNTLAYDDKGLPHVFEHATLGGSEKYQNSNLFFEMNNKTYNTYLNAFTAQQSTAYPMGSLSEEQLFEYFKFYIDGVFAPNILKDERLLDREAYRYILADKDSDLSLSGVVYSEMLARENDIRLSAHFNTVKTLFDDSFVSMQTGGLTKDIPKITLEDLKAFHDTYYHPSNMVMTLYGDIDYEKYLIYASEEYLNKFTKKTFDKSDKLYKTANGYIEKRFDFPVSSNSDSDNKGIVTYAISCEGMTAYEAGLFTLVLQDLESDAGYVMTYVDELLPDASFYVNDMLSHEKPYIEFCFENVSESDKDKVKEIMEKSFADEVNEGFGIETAESYRDTYEIDTEFMRDEHGFTDYLYYFYQNTFRDNGKDLTGYFKYEMGKRDAYKRYNDGTIDSLIDRYLGGDRKAVLTVTTPRRGLSERQNEERLERLENMKHNMSSDEITALIDRNNRYDKWVEENNSYSDISKVRVASVSSLEVYRPICYAYEENLEGVRFIRSDIDDIKYNYVNILLDASSVPYKDTLKLRLLSDMLTYLPTTNYDNNNLSNEYALCTYSYNSSVYTNVLQSGGYNPYLSFRVMSLDRHLDRVFELIDETFFETKFDDVEKLKAYISRKYNTLLVDYESDPSGYAEAVAGAISNKDNLYDLHLYGTDYVDYLSEIMKYDDAELKNLLTECKDLLGTLLNKDKMVCEIISNFGMMSEIKSKVLNFSRKLTDERREKVSYDEDLKPYDGNVAILSNSNVQYNYLVLPLKSNGIEYTAKLDVFNGMLNSDILYPEFRVKRSCYGAYAESSQLQLYLDTYRDPNLKETYEVYDKLIDYIDANEINEDDFEDFKLSAYSRFSYPLTKFNASATAINETFENWDEKRPDRYEKYMKEIKATSIEDIKDIKELYIRLIESGRKVTAGGAKVVLDNKEMFDIIVDNYVK